MVSPLQGNYLLGDTCRLTEASPGVLHYKTLWISRHCLAVSAQRFPLAREGVKSILCGGLTRPLAFPRLTARQTGSGQPMKHRSVERCYHQKSGGTGKLLKPMPPKPYEGRSDQLSLAPVMVSREKVSCYDTRYADQNQPMCICHSQPPFLFVLQDGSRP